MVKEPIVKCSQCGHNTRTCIHATNHLHNNTNNHHHSNKGSLKLFGVKILMEREFESIKKSLSIGNLNSSVSSSSLVAEQLHTDGYLSDGPVHHARRKGQAWTDIEHQLFLKGLEKLGRGDWKGIANKFVMTRSASQVASHAQKHFLRRTTSDHKKKRLSVFDTPLIKHPIHTLPPPHRLDGFGVGPGFVEPKKSAKLFKEPQEQNIMTTSGVHGYPKPTPKLATTTNNCIPIFPHPNPFKQSYVLLQTPSDYAVGAAPFLHRYPMDSFGQPRIVVDREPPSKVGVPQDALELRLAPAKASPGPSASGAIKVT
ncbi:hypothetical protein V2J09_021076 [Rumex salicifolius]